MPGESSSGKILSQGVVAGRLANKGSPPPRFLPTPQGALRPGRHPAALPRPRAGCQSAVSLPLSLPSGGPTIGPLRGGDSGPGALLAAVVLGSMPTTAVRVATTHPPPPMVYPPNGREGVPWSWTTLPAGGALPFGRCYYSGHHMPFPPSSFLVNES